MDTTQTMQFNATKRIFHEKSLPSVCLIKLSRMFLTLLFLWLFLAPVSNLQAEESETSILTEEERSWLQEQASNLTLCFNPDFPPLEFADNTGEFIGMGADLVAYLEQKVGVRFPRKMVADWNEQLAALKSGECAISPTIVRTEERESYISFTNPYAVVPVVLITSEHHRHDQTLEDFKGKRVAVVSGFASETYLKKHDRIGYEIIPMPDVIRGLRAVSFGQVDAFLGNLAVAAYYIEKEGIPNLNVAGNTDYTFPFSIGISQKHPKLFDIFRKTLNKTSPKVLEDIRKQWITLSLEHKLSPKTLMILDLVAVFFVLMILSLALISYLLKRRLNEKIVTLEKARRKVTEQAELLQFATEATQAGIWDYHPQESKMYLNRQWFTMADHPMKGRDISLDDYKQYIHPKDLAAVEQTLQNYRIAQGSNQATVEFRILRQDGSSFWVLSTGKTVEWDENGQPTRVIGLDINVQEFKETQVNLIQSEKKFRAIFDYAPHAISITDMETGQYLDANNAFLEKYGIEREKLSTYSPVDFSLTPRHKIEKIIEELNRVGHIKEIETKVRVLDGSEKHLLFSTVLLELEGKKQALSMAIDISELKKTEKNLQESEARFRSLFHNSPIPLASSRRDGQNLEFNKTFTKLFGYSIEDIPDHGTWWDLAYPDPEYRDTVISSWSADIERAANDNTPVKPQEYCVTCKDGKQRYVIFEANVMGDDLLVSCFDVTERNEKEAALKENMELLRATFNTTNDGILAVDKEMQILQANPLFYKLWRIPAEMQHSKDEPKLRQVVLDQLEDPTFFLSQLETLYSSQLQNKFELTFKDGRIYEIYSAPMMMDEHKAGRVWFTRDITERRTIERTIDFERRQLLSIFDSFDEIIYVSDPETYEMIFANRRLREMIGYNPKGKLCYKVLQGKDKPCDFCTNPIILANGGQPHRWDYHNPRTDTDVAVVDQIIRWPDGRNVRLEFAMDVTERKRTEEALKTSEKKLRSIFSAMRDVILILDRKGIVNEVAPTNTDLLYLPPNDLLNKRLKDIFTQEITEEFLGKILESLDGKKTVSFDYNLDINQQPTWFSAVISPISNDQVIWVARDITDRKIAEEKLRFSEEKFSKTFALSPDVIIISTVKDGALIDVNMGFEELSGWSREEAIGKTGLELNLWVDPEARHEMMNELAKHNEVLLHEARFRRKNGETLTGLFSIKRITISGQSTLLMVVRDITKQKQMQEERQKLERQLLQSQKMEAIGTLAGGVAHEINNPIGIIINYARLILDDAEQESQIQSDATMIVEEGERVARIVKDLLAFSRQEKETHSPAYLKDVLNSTMSLIGKMLKKSDIDVVMNLEDDLPKIKCRSQQLMQILMNVLNNAKDELDEAYPEGHENKTIEISLASFKKDNRRWQRISIRDNGRGIPDEVKERIFNPFFTTKPRDRGTGLGLSISHGIAKDHHGKLWFENLPEGGTRFYLDIPVDNGWKKNEKLLQP